MFEIVEVVCFDHLLARQSCAGSQHFLDWWFVLRKRLIARHYFKRGCDVFIWNFFLSGNFKIFSLPVDFKLQLKKVTTFMEKFHCISRKHVHYFFQIFVNFHCLSKMRVLRISTIKNNPLLQFNDWYCWQLAGKTQFRRNFHKMALVIK